MAEATRRFATQGRDKASEAATVYRETLLDLDESFSEPGDYLPRSARLQENDSALLEFVSNNVYLLAAINPG